ncbi:hypothetical protein KFE98_00385 [bacterium SCSIO 12741]|nr:hypothetical protein KFE98_00385 [bacterium SCSIO 12741]
MSKQINISPRKYWIGLVLLMALLLIFYLLTDRTHALSLASSQGIDGPLRRWANGYLGTLFRFTYIGTLSLLAIPAMVRFALTWKTRVPWQKGLFLFYLFMLLLLGVKGYTNFRYLSTTVVINTLFVLAMVGEWASGVDRSWRFRLGVGLFLVIMINPMMNLGKFSHFLKIRLAQSQSASAPTDLYEEMERKQMINPDNQLTVAHASNWFYFTDIPAQTYGISTVMKNRVYRGMVTVDSLDYLFPMVQDSGYRLNESTFQQAFQKLKQDYGSRYMLFYPYREYYIPELFFLARKGAYLIGEDKGYKLYRLKDDPNENIAWLNMESKLFQFRKSNVSKSGELKANARFKLPSIERKASWKELCLSFNQHDTWLEKQEILLNGIPLEPSRKVNANWYFKLPDSLQTFESLKLGNAYVGENLHLLYLGFVDTSAFPYLNQGYLDFGLVDSNFTVYNGNYDPLRLEIRSDGTSGRMFNRRSVKLKAGKYRLNVRLTAEDENQKGELMFWLKVIGEQDARIENTYSSEDFGKVMELPFEFELEKDGEVYFGTYISDGYFITLKHCSLQQIG